MKPRRAIKPQEELEMDPVEVFARIKTVSTVQVFTGFLSQFHM
jgi:hypothetical protein